MIKNPSHPKQKKVVTIGGGSGQYILLSALRDFTDLDISAIVSMADSGGSTGRLRDELGVLPPGDILKCLVALSKKRNRYRELLMKRFTDPQNQKLIGHSVGNMLLTFLSEYIDDFPAATIAFGKLLESQGKVLPVTINKINLIATLADGKKIVGETNIDISQESNRARIVDLALSSVDHQKIQAYPPALEAIEEADEIIIGPGDIYTSILPNLIIPQMKQAIGRSRAKLIYVVNLMTKKGETDGFSGDDFVKLIEQYLDRKINIIIANSAKPDKRILKPYQLEGAELVSLPDEDVWTQAKIVTADLLSTKGDLARHDAKKLRKTLKKVFSNFT